MKKLIVLFLILLTKVSFGQFPIVEEFNSGTTWGYTNGAGLQNYGPPENYATTNIGTTPYPNSSTVTITSPTYNFTSSCGSDITISFPISGNIENGFDYMYLEYYNAGAWVNLGGFTGSVTGTYTNTTIPNTATQFRFRLVTDASFIVWYRSNYSSWSFTQGGAFNTPVDISNTYVGGAPKTVYVYYYDITRFTIDCATVLPIELEIFEGYNISEGVNKLSWVTATEVNNDYFTLSRSRDGQFWDDIAVIEGGGNLNTPSMYEYTDDSYTNGINYYRLSQTDFDGKSESFKIISIDNGVKQVGDILDHTTDLSGRVISNNYTGLRIVVFRRETLTGTRYISTLLYGEFRK